MIEISSSPLPVSAILKSVENPETGATNAFVGTVRLHTQDRKVLRLEFEAYEKMALKEMEKIAAQARKKWPIKKIAIHHRVGTLDIGDVAVVIAVSTPHRLAAFQACQYAIDTLKLTVPIWKKEIFENGETWVAAHP